ncbi:MAG: threonylcarbamoyl-AMP synthase [Parvularculaceae bacterium]|nr:threonylcarbamoyl-AMP synthase [Parvularculaceae bacterium]
MTEMSPADDIATAADILRRGGLVAIPTETVYGLAADATNDGAVARIYEAKGRPSFNPLICHVSGVDMAARFVEFSPLARRLAEKFWPGPLTLVLPRRADASVSLLASAGLPSLAVRAPAHNVAQAIIAKLGRPIAAPSANRSGGVSPTTAQHVADELKERVDFIVDGGPCVVGVESTIVKCDADMAILLRPGGVTRADIEQEINMALITPEPVTIEAPGMLTSHYAPHARLRLNARDAHTDEAYLAFGPARPHPDMANLSIAGDMREAAANLFAHLHALDKICTEKKLAGIAVAPIPSDGLGEAINDRLARAAAPRPVMNGGKQHHSRPVRET